MKNFWNNIGRWLLLWAILVASIALQIVSLAANRL